MSETLLQAPSYQWLLDIARASSTSPDAEIQEVLEQAHQQNLSHIDVLIDEGMVREEDFLRGLAEHMDIEWLPDAVDPADEQNLDDLKTACPAALAIRQQVVPLALDEEKKTLTLACYNPLSLEARQALTRQIPQRLNWVMAQRRHIRTALSNIYGVGADTFEKILAGRDLDADAFSDQDEASVLDDDTSDEASVLRFVNQIIKEALAQKATDIHVEPQHDILRIRYRVDGHLLDVPVPERINTLQSSVIARLKIMSRLDVAERRIPQDGRINLKNEGKNIDVRVATIPSVEGETVSLRLLNQEKFNLAALQLEDTVEKPLLDTLKLTNGVILATGPTGSGKSTSLYCFLDHLNHPETRTVTIEDPVENKLPGIVQIAVRPEVGLTFAKGLRSILRADPNIVMVGEIRDTETAEIAIRASLTGHLVFSTLHTNTSIGGISRLLDMDVEPFLVSASVRAFLAQRLVRKLCPDCKEPLENWSSEEAQHLGLPEYLGHLTGQAYRAKGCSECRNTGYQGRLAVYELCVVSPKIQELISEGGDENKIYEQARQEGFESLRDYGWRKVLKGDTSIEEILSTT